MRIFSTLFTFIFIFILIGIENTLSISDININKDVHIVSIVDKSSLFYCSVKLHSVVSSSAHAHLLVFHFLTFDQESEDYLKDYFTNCFSTIRYEIVAWSSVSIHQQPLSFSGFDSWIIYSRIYLPLIFPVQRYIYLDNDIVVNGDIIELFTYELHSKPFEELLPKSKQQQQSGTSSSSSSTTTPTSISRRKSNGIPIIGFVFEVNHAYSGYIQSHFNVSHPLVRKILQNNHPEIFFNAGVALVNAEQWRKENMTKKAELLLSENTIHPGRLYHSKAVGDQGLFYLLLNGRMSFLPPKWNMRRLPNKTVRFLNQNELGTVSNLPLFWATPTTPPSPTPSLISLPSLLPSPCFSLGIVHFAGTTHGKSILLCDHPLLYPHLSTAAIPLFLSVVSSLYLKCSLSHQYTPFSCFQAIITVQEAVSSGNITVHYNPGRGGFKWPPPSVVTSHERNLTF